MRLLIFVSILLFCCASCGGDDTSEDGDMDTATDGDTSYERDDEGIASILGTWQFFNANAKTVNWYQRQSLSAYYMIVEDKRILYWWQRADGPICLTQEVDRQTVTRFVASNDTETCWYDLELSDSGALGFYSRHEDDTDASPWEFRFQPTAEIPDFDESICSDHPACLNFNEDLDNI